MACEKRWIKNLIKEYVEILSKKFDIECVMLFGSYAWGKPGKYSDLDLAIISKSFKKLSDIERIMILTDYARNLKTPRPIGIDVVGFTPEEFRKAGYFDLCGEIKERGKIVYSKAA